MFRSSLFHPILFIAFMIVPLLVSSTGISQNYVPPSAPMIGSPNTVTANAPVPRPTTQPCTVTLFQDYDFADFNPKFFSYTPPAGCPGPWAAVVFEADWPVDAGRQFDRTAEVWVGGPMSISAPRPSRRTMCSAPGMSKAT